MKKSEFRTPLIQSAAVLGGVLVLITIVASSGAGGSEGGTLAVIFNIGKLILFVIGMAIALPFSIGILIAIFLAAVAMVNPDQASQMYADLKKNFSLQALTQNRLCCPDQSAGLGITQEEYDQMKQELAALTEKNLALQKDINKINSDNSLLAGSVGTLSTENFTLKERIAELNQAVGELQASEKSLRGQLEQLTAKVDKGPDPALIGQLDQLKKLHDATQSKLQDILSRLESLEERNPQAPTSGIFSYIEKEEERQLFMQKVEEAVAQEMTYAQIDEFLTKNLPTKLDKCLKEHPSLTKSYIRTLRKE